MSRRRIALPALLAAALLAGCRNVDEDGEIAAYRSVLDEDAPAELPPLAAGEPLTLQRAMALANRDNEALALQGEDYLQALVDKKRQAAQFMPTLSLAPTYFSRDPSDDPTARFSSDRSLDVPLRAELDELQPYSQLARIDRAGSTIESRRALLLDAKASLLLDVARAYYEVLRSERRVEVLADSLQVQEERVRDVEAQNQVGFARVLDVEQARAQAASTRVALVQAGSDGRNARHALAFLIGAPRVDGPLADRFEAPAEVEPVDAIEREALAVRQDLVAAHALVDATLHGVDVAVGQYYPSVSLNLNYFLYKESIPDQSLFSALVSANLPLFTFGKIHADVRTAWSLFRQAKLAESQLRRRIAEEVQQSHEDFTTSGARLVELKVQVAAAQEAFDQASDLARFGKATNLERLVAQNQLLTAQLDLSNEQYDRKIGYLAIERARGALTLRLPELASADDATPAPAR